MKNAPAYLDVHHWVEHFVVGLTLCPFAKIPFVKDQIRFVVTDESDPEKILLTFWEEAQLLLRTAPSEISNTLLILGKLDVSFDDYLNLFYTAEQLLEDQELEEDLQLASFHPYYQFADHAPDDLKNYTNRSPYPIIHLLRVEEVAQAIKMLPETENVPEMNRQKLEEIGLDGIRKIVPNL